LFCEFSYFSSSPVVSSTQSHEKPSAGVAHGVVKRLGALVRIRAFVRAHLFTTTTKRIQTRVVGAIARAPH